MVELNKCNIVTLTNKDTYKKCLIIYTICLDGTYETMNISVDAGNYCEVSTDDHDAYGYYIEKLCQVLTG